MEADLKVLDLVCGQGHGFEGWFASEEDYASQRRRGLLTCPVCNSSGVEKRLSAPRLNLGREREQAVASPLEAGAAVMAGLTPDQQGRFLAAVRQLVQASEDVGERFAAEARRIHHGEALPRGIRGQASVAEALELLQEGVAVLPLPDLPILKDTLQ